MKIKLCGFTNKPTIKAAIESGADFLGFVFHQKSPRNVDIATAVNLAKEIPNSVSKVSVTVDSSLDFLQKINDNLNPEYFQLHGQEDIVLIEKIKNKFPEKKIIKAIGVSKQLDLDQIRVFEDLVDHILLDNKIPGSGHVFDWNILHNLETKNDWMLSGGLNVDNITTAISQTKAPIVDISSGIEKIRGEKSSELITKITTIVNNLNTK